MSSKDAENLKLQLESSVESLGEFGDLVRKLVNVMPLVKGTASKGVAQYEIDLRSLGWSPFGRRLFG